MYDFVMPFIIQMVAEMRTRENEVKIILFRLKKKPKSKRKLPQRTSISSPMIWNL